MMYMPKNGTYLICTKVTYLTGNDCRRYIANDAQVKEFHVVGC